MTRHEIICAASEAIRRATQAADDVLASPAIAGLSPDQIMRAADRGYGETISAFVATYPTHWREVIADAITYLERM